MEVGVRADGGRVEPSAALGDGEALRSVPARVVEHQDDVALAPGAGPPREAGEQRLEEGLREAAAEVPDRLAAGRLHEGDDVQPLVSVVAEGDRPLADRRPDPPPDRLPAEAGRTQCVQPSSAQTSTGRSGCSAAACATASSNFFSAPPAARAWPSGGAAAAGPGPTTRAASAPPSHAADAPPPG